MASKLHEAPMSPAALHQERMRDLSQLNLATIHDVLVGVYNDRDVSRFESRLAANYRDHDTFLGHDRVGLKAFVLAAPPTLSWQVIEDDAQGDLVMVHGRHGGMSPAIESLAAVYVFRLVDGLIVEHWNALGEEDVVRAAPRSAEPVTS